MRGLHDLSRIETSMLYEMEGKKALLSTCVLRDCEGNIIKGSSLNVGGVEADSAYTLVAKHSTSTYRFRSIAIGDADTGDTHTKPQSPSTMQAVTPYFAYGSRLMFEQALIPKTQYHGHYLTPIPPQILNPSSSTPP